MRFVLLGALGLTFITAAITKAAAPESAARFLQYSLLGEPGRLWVAIVAGIAALEAALGLAILLMPRRLVLAAALAALAVFTIALARAAVDPVAPSCGCFGILPARARGEASIALARNGALLWMTGWLLVHGRRPGSNRSGRAPALPATGGTDDHPVASPHRGFSLMEVLVVIVILSIIISITIPALAGARRRARSVSTLSMLRHAHAALTMYAGDYRDHFPYLATPGQPDAPIRVGAFVIREGYFAAQMKYWTELIAPHYLDALPKTLALTDHPRGPAFVIGPEGSDLYTSRYWLTHAAVATPAWWEDGLPSDLGGLRGMRLTDVAFPAQKGLLLDVRAGAFEQPAAAPDPNGYIGVGDGSARAENWDQLSVSGRFVGQRPYGAIGWPVLATRSGVAGTDF